MVTHFSILAWEIPWTEELGGLQSMGLQRDGHDWATEHRKNLHTVPHSGCTKLHCHQQSVCGVGGGFSSPHMLSSIYRLQIFLWWLFWPVWCEVDLQCHLANSMSSLEKCLIRSSAYFLTGFFFFIYWAAWAVYKFWWLSLCPFHCLQIFPPNIWVSFPLFLLYLFIYWINYYFLIEG